MSTRRKFLRSTVYSGLALSLPFSWSSCTSMSQADLPKISLAQWSLNRAIKAGTIKAKDFARVTRKEYGIGAVEYVSTFYKEQQTNAQFWADMLSQSQGEGVENLLIMVDGEGDLGDTDEEKRNQAVANHSAWVDIAAKLGCHSIRVNAFGVGHYDTLAYTLSEGLGKLSEYGAKAGIHILLENHGLHTSNARYMVGIIERVNNPYLGTLPDFGNWCQSVEWGGTRDDSCENVYDQAKGVMEFMPYAKGVSAKTYDFDEQGNQPRIDYAKLLGIVKEASYEGYIGIEYEGENLSEPEGIRATKTLIERTWQELA